jgi:hypothetical protein
MKNGYYITQRGLKYDIEEVTDINLDFHNVIELVISSGPKTIWCRNNYLTNLAIPDGIEYIRCSNNKLTKLDLPDSVQYVKCINNNLTELIVPDNCEVYCDPHVKVITRTMYNRSKRLKDILK